MNAERRITWIQTKSQEKSEDINKKLIFLTSMTILVEWIMIF